MNFPCPELFSSEAGVVYMDNASMAPLPLVVERASIEAVSSKARPWLRDRDAAHALVTDLRTRAAALVGARPSDMGVTCSASYGLAVASANLQLRKDERILVLEDDHSSQMLTWEAKARRSGAIIDKIPRPTDGNWTRAILEHLKLEDSRRIALASLCESFWIDGSHIDLHAVCAALHALGAAVVLDLTQSAGVLDIDLPALEVDFAVFPMYKWLLGPYSLAFLYVAPRWQEGTPLEQNGFNRVPSGDYALGATRFDMGERDTFVGVPTALAALELGATWSRNKLREHLASLTGHIATKLSAAGFQCCPESQRSPHILGVGGVPEGVAAMCRTRRTFFTQRLSYVRISPHVFNSMDDADRCADELISAARSTL